MSENKQFVGQPVLSQILCCIPAAIINKSCRKHNANRYYKKIPVRVHPVSLLYGVFSCCNGLCELCEGMLACEGKLTQLGFDKAPRVCQPDSKRVAKASKPTGVKGY